MFMIFDADDENKSRDEKEEDDVEACSSGISMRSSQIGMERDMSNLLVKAGEIQAINPDIDATELHD